MATHPQRHASRDPERSPWTKPLPELAQTELPGARGLSQWKSNAPLLGAGLWRRANLNPRELALFSTAGAWTTPARAPRRLRAVGLVRWSSSGHSAHPRPNASAPKGASQLGYWNIAWRHRLTGEIVGRSDDCQPGHESGFQRQSCAYPPCSPAGVFLIANAWHTQSREVRGWCSMLR